LMMGRGRKGEKPNTGTKGGRFVKGFFREVLAINVTGKGKKEKSLLLVGGKKE